MEPEVARQLMAVQGYTELGLLDLAQEELDAIDPSLDIVNII